MDMKFALIYLHLALCTCVVNGVEHYNHEEIAQAYCAAHQTVWTFAIRRDIWGKAPPCRTLCQNATEKALGTINHQRDSVYCYNALYIIENYPNVQKNQLNAVPGVVNLGTYSYGEEGCGHVAPPSPNYCCCRTK